MHRNLRATVFALVLVLAATSAQAYPLSSRPGSTAESDLLARVWTWVGSLLSPGLIPVWEKAGSSMDPNGEPQNNSWSDPADKGSSKHPTG